MFCGHNKVFGRILIMNGPRWYNSDQDMTRIRRQIFRHIDVEKRRRFVFHTAGHIDANTTKKTDVYIRSDACWDESIR